MTIGGNHGQRKGTSADCGLRTAESADPFDKVEVGGGGVFLRASVWSKNKGKGNASDRYAGRPTENINTSKNLGGFGLRSI